MSLFSLSVNQLADMIFRESRTIKYHLKNAEMHRTQGDASMRWREISAVLDNLKEIEKCVGLIDGQIKTCLVEMHKNEPNERDIKKDCMQDSNFLNKI